MESPTNITCVKENCQLDANNDTKNGKTVQDGAGLSTETFTVTPGTEYNTGGHTQNKVDNEEMTDENDEKKQADSKLITSSQPGLDASQLLHETHRSTDSVTRKDDIKNKKTVLVTELRQTIADLVQAMEHAPELAVPHENSPVFSKTPLKAFSSSGAVPYEAFKNSGGIRCIVLAVRKHYMSSAVLDYGSQALTTIAILDTESIRDMMMAGVVESVLLVLKSTEELGDDPKISALKLLRTLTQVEENRTQIWEADGIKMITEIMRQSEGEGRTLSHAALLLSNLAFGNKDIKTAVGQSGGIAAIAKAMNDHSKLATVQARGSLALRNLCFASEENQTAAGRYGAIEALISALQLHKEDREIVHQSCVALANLSNNNTENRNRIVAVGGASILIELMQRYKESTTVHDDCLAMVRNIAVENGQGQEQIGENGGVALIIQALDRFKRDDKLCEKGCAALRYLCFLPRNSERVSAERGMDIIVKILKIHKGNAAVVEHALLAIGNATFENDANKEAVGKSDGMLAIVQAIEQNRLNAVVQEHGCRVMRNLVAGMKDNAARAVDAGAITAGVLAMIGYADSASIQEQACAMMLNLTEYSGVREKLGQADVMRLAEKAISNHAKHRGVQLQAGILIDRLNGYEILTPKPGNQQEDDSSATVHNRRSSRRMRWPFGGR